MASQCARQASHDVCVYISIVDFSTLFNDCFCVKCYYTKPQALCEYQVVRQKDAGKMTPIISISENSASGFREDQTHLVSPELKEESLLLCTCVRVAGGGHKSGFLCSTDVDRGLDGCGGHGTAVVLEDDLVWIQLVGFSQTVRSPASVDSGATTWTTGRFDELDNSSRLTFCTIAPPVVCGLLDLLYSSRPNKHFPRKPPRPW